MIAWVPISEAAQQVGLNTGTITNYIQAGEIPVGRALATNSLGHQRMVKAVRVADVKRIRQARQDARARKAAAVPEIQWLISCGWSEELAIQRISKVYKIHYDTLVKRLREATQGAAA